MKYKRIYNYLQSSDRELKALAIGLMASDKNLSNYVSKLYGYKLEYFFKCYYDIIHQTHNEVLSDSYFEIISNIIVSEFNGNLKTRRNILNSLLHFGNICNYSTVSFDRDMNLEYRFGILCSLLQYTKFFRKHKRRYIITSNKKYTLEDLVMRIDYGLRGSSSACYDAFLCLKLLKTFKK